MLVRHTAVSGYRFTKLRVLLGAKLHGGNPTYEDLVHLYSCNSFTAMSPSQIPGTQVLSSSVVHRTPFARPCRYHAGSAASNLPRALVLVLTLMVTLGSSAYATILVDSSFETGVSVEELDANTAGLVGSDKTAAPGSDWGAECTNRIFYDGDDFSLHTRVSSPVAGYAPTEPTGALPEEPIRDPLAWEAVPLETIPEGSHESSSPSNATRFSTLSAGLCNTFSSSANCAVLIAAVNGLHPAFCSTAWLLIRDMNAGGIRRMRRRQLQ